MNRSVAIFQNIRKYRPVTGFGGLAFIIVGLIGLITLPPAGAENRTVLLLMDLLGIGVGLYYFLKAIVEANEDVSYDLASPQEQDVAMAAHLGIPVSQVIKMRRQSQEAAAKSDTSQSSSKSE